MYLSACGCPQPYTSLPPILPLPTLFRSTFSMMPLFSNKLTPIRDHSTNSSKIQSPQFTSTRITIYMYINVLKGFCLGGRCCLASLEHVLSPVTGNLIIRHTRARGAVPRKVENMNKCLQSFPTTNPIMSGSQAEEILQEYLKSRESVTDVILQTDQMLSEGKVD